MFLGRRKKKRDAKATATTFRQAATDIKQRILSVLRYAAIPYTHSGDLSQNLIPFFPYSGLSWAHGGATRRAHVATLGCTDEASQLRETWYLKVPEPLLLLHFSIFCCDVWSNQRPDAAGGGKTGLSSRRCVL